MGRYYTKAELYKEIQNVRHKIGINNNEAGLNIIDYCESGSIFVESIQFATNGLRGMAVIGDTENKDIILLNSHRTEIEQNFDCAHELIHLLLHRNLRRKTFNCIDKIYAHQDSFIEWQANDGAAELLVPYHLFLPCIKKEYSSIANGYSDITSFKDTYSSLFNVAPTVIEYRLENLKYEIHQFLNGVPIENIEILSLSQQEKSHLNIQSLNNSEAWNFVGKLDANKISLIWGQA